MPEDKKFIKEFEQKVKDTIKKYKLCNKKERIIVACSGGKDSTTVLYLLHKWGYQVEGLIIDLLIGPWSEENLKNAQSFCQDHKIKLNVVNLRNEFGCSMCFMRSGIQKKVKLNNCMICGIIKRWLLNKKTRELKADKIVTGHNLDDAAETFMMNLLKGNMKLNLGQGPATGVIKDKKFVPRIKPLYFCLNEEVKRYSQINKFPVLLEACPCSVEVFRKKIRRNLTEMEKNNSQIKHNIVANFLKLLPSLKNKYKNNEKLNYCTACQEPSRQEFCKMCELIKIWKS